MKKKKKKNEKVCPNTKSKIRKHFFHADEFLKAVESVDNKEIQALDVNLDKRWQSPLQFESLEILETIEEIEKPNRDIIRNINDDSWGGGSDDLF